MTYKRILAHVDESEAGLARGDVARRVAGLFSTDLELLTAGILPYDDDNRPKQEKKREEVARGVRAMAERIGQRLGAPQHAVIAPPDLIRNEIASLVRPADIAVIGAPEHDALMAADDVFQACLFHSGRPCLILPHAMATPDFGKRILVGWKDTREGARAVHDAIPFLERAESIEIAAFVETGDPAHADHAAFHRIADYLRARGLPVTRATVHPIHTDAAKALLRHVEAEHCDMIVMGGFGHTRLSEFLFGGMTRAVLNAMPTPVLMAH